MSIKIYVKYVKNNRDFHTTKLNLPTGNLDSVTAGEIINILKTLAKDRNKCVIVVTHSKEVADSADIILELSGKKLKKVNKMNLEVE
jgi:putative ABC transport system ATP-binding protein